VSPEKAGVDHGRRECSIPFTVFGIVWLSRLGREITYLLHGAEFFSRS